jgi:hypothetical protein
MDSCAPPPRNYRATVCFSKKRNCRNYRATALQLPRNYAATVKKVTSATAATGPYGPVRSCTHPKPRRKPQ